MLVYDEKYHKITEYYTHKDVKFDSVMKMWKKGTYSANVRKKTQMRIKSIDASQRVIRKKPNQKQSSAENEEKSS